MKKSVKQSFFLTLAAITFASCSTLATITSSVVTAAGEIGLIDSGVAKSISKTSDAIGKAAEVITPEQEYYVGRAVAGTILRKYKLYSAPKTEKYLNMICQSLVLNSEKPYPYRGYCVAILDSDEVNAFATPGGHILVTRGLLRTTSTEDEIAAIIAHEISHIQLKHAVSAIKSSRATGAILATAGTAAVVYTEGNSSMTSLVDALDETVGNIVQSLVESGFSQTQEFQADKNALVLMADAGYNVESMNVMLESLLEKSNTKTGFGKTHPTPKARIKNLSKEYKKYDHNTMQQSREKRFREIQI